VLSEWLPLPRTAPAVRSASVLCVVVLLQSEPPAGVAWACLQRHLQVPASCGCRGWWPVAGGLPRVWPRQDGSALCCLERTMFRKQKPRLPPDIVLASSGISIVQTPPCIMTGFCHPYLSPFGHPAPCPPCPPCPFLALLTVMGACVEPVCRRYSTLAPLRNAKLRPPQPNQSLAASSYCYQHKTRWEQAREPRTTEQSVSD
jgi:hypothetical protein